MRNVVIWAMLPLAVLNGRPLLGCVCADGKYKTDCPAMAERAQDDASATAEPTAAPTEGKSCCQPSCYADESPQEPADSCCAASATRDENPAPTGGLSGRGGCCHPVIESAVPPLRVGAVELDSDHDLPNPSALVFQAVEPSDARPLVGHMEGDIGPPAPGLVIVLRRLIL